MVKLSQISISLFRINAVPWTGAALILAAGNFVKDRTILQAKEATQQPNVSNDADTVLGMLCSTYCELNCNQDTDEVRQAFDNLYQAMTGIEISDFDPTNYLKEKELNPFEIAFALGKLLGEKYPSMFSTKENIKDVDSLGFSLVTACVGMKNAHSKNLHPPHQIHFRKVV